MRVERVKLWRPGKPFLFLTHKRDIAGLKSPYCGYLQRSGAARIGSTFGLIPQRRLVLSSRGNQSVAVQQCPYHPCRHQECDYRHYRCDGSCSRARVSRASHAHAFYASKTDINSNHDTNFWRHRPSSVLLPALDFKIAGTPRYHGLH
jgi:hypothetical protein